MNKVFSLTLMLKPIILRLDHFIKSKHAQPQTHDMKGVRTVCDFTFKYLQTIYSVLVTSLISVHQLDFFTVYLSLAL